MSSSVKPPAPVLTSAGRRNVQQRLDHALEALARLAQRMSDGDRSEDDLAEHLRLVEEIEELTAILSSAADVANVAEDPSIVEVGDEVVVEFDDGEVETFALVHPVEAAADDERISIASPLGKALLGTHPGDRVMVNAPGGSYGATVREHRRLT